MLLLTLKRSKNIIIKNWYRNTTDPGKSSKRRSKQKKPVKRGGDDSEDSEEEDQLNQGSNSQSIVKMTAQPSCMVNGVLEPHQIDSLNWMISLNELGLNGILADDMVRF